MKTTLLTTILSAAALSAALFASPASAQSCTCQRTVAPRVIVTAPQVDQYYGDDEDFYTYGTPEVIVGYPLGYWAGGWYARRYIEHGYYSNRSYDRGYRGGEHVYVNGGRQGVVRGGGGVRRR